MSGHRSKEFVHFTVNVDQLVDSQFRRCKDVWLMLSACGQVNDVLRRAEVWETHHVSPDGGRSPRPPLVSLPPTLNSLHDIFLYSLFCCLHVLVFLVFFLIRISHNNTELYLFAVTQNSVTDKWKHQNLSLCSSFLAHAIILDILLCHVSMSLAIIAPPSFSRIDSPPSKIVFVTVTRQKY